MSLTIHPTAYIHPTAVVTGDVALGARVSVWPTAVIRGDTDRITHPSTAALWQEKLPESDVVMMKTTGHAPMLERPTESAALVAVWWQRRGFFR